MRADRSYFKTFWRVPSGAKALVSGHFFVGAEAPTPQIGGFAAGSRESSRLGFAGLILAAAAALLAGVSLRPAAAAGTDRAGSRPRSAPAAKPAGTSRAGRRALHLPKAFKGKLPITELTEDEATVHALDRLAFGPQPGEVKQIEQMGLAKWIDQQLDPKSIPDDALEQDLAQFSTLRMSTAQLLARFEFPQMAAKKAGLTLQEFQQQRQAKVQQELAALRQSGEFDPARAQMLRVDGTPQQILAELSMAQVVRAVYSPRQLEERLADFWFNHFNVYARKGFDLWYLPAYEREAIRGHAMGHFEGLLEATAKSPAMLFYLDNWLSVDPIAFQQFRGMIAARQRQAAMMRACGLFVMLATPAQIAQCERRMARQQGARGAAAKQAPVVRGLNENYGRELVELHTLGVHYTQADVTAMAHVFTGWTIRQPRFDPQFAFDARLHTPGPKEVLGYRIDAGGMQDGEEMLHDLAGDPRCAHFIAFELARHFVMDQPPKSLVERMTKAYLKSHGDIRQVMRAMIYSPEFWSRQAYRAKMKSPFDFVASALRATGADVQIAMPMVNWVARMGEPLFLCIQPNGYPDTAADWVSTDELLNRMDFAVALAANRMPGTRVDLTPFATADGAGGDPQGVLNDAIHAVLHGQVSEATRQALASRVVAPQVVSAKLGARAEQARTALIFGLVLGSPDFQRH